MPFFIGGLSKCIASTFFHPLTLIKTRQQKQRYTSDEVEHLREEAKKLKSEHTVKVRIKESTRVLLFIF